MSSSGDIVLRTSSSLSLDLSADETEILEIFRIKDKVYADSYKGTIMFHNKRQLYLFVADFFCANDLISDEAFETLVEMLDTL